MVRFGKLDDLILVESTRTFGQCNKCFKVTLEKYMSKNESTKRQSRTKQVESSIKPLTLVMIKVILVRIVLKLKLSFIRLPIMIYLM
jgi:hypothetical protein